MKVCKPVFLFISFAALLLWSCDKVKEPYFTQKGTGTDTSTVNRTVLLEDYTGHKCVNCPTAAVTAHTLEEMYNGNLIILAVHAGYFAIPGSGNYALDLRSATGEDWYSTFGVTSNPIGMINRIETGGSRMLT
ncbi:MAG: hypothetical protein Q8867_09360, partial [Bacteroidota bacterium]|nr:hypothetical protein [Bacteroidota bacterium]